MKNILCWFITFIAAMTMINTSCTTAPSGTMSEPLKINSEVYSQQVTIYEESIHITPVLELSPPQLLLELPNTTPLHLSGIMVTPFPEQVKGITDFAHNMEGQPLSEYINGTPKVEILNQRLTIDLASPKLGAMRKFDDSLGMTPSDAWYYEIGGLSVERGGIGIFFSNDEDKSVFLIYVNVDVEINGSYNNWGSINEFVNVSLKTGWNFILYEYNPTTNISTYTSASQTIPKGFSAGVFFYQ